MATKTKMTPEQATRFEHQSQVNAAIVAHSLECGYKPYHDVYTYIRWQAQGYQVRRGEHSIKLSVIALKEFESEFGELETKKIFTNSHVFCRCQVDIKGNGHKPVAPITKEVPAIVIMPVIPIKETPKAEIPKVEDTLMKGWSIV